MTSWYPAPPSPASKLYDYANKQWAGVTGVYYAARYSALAAGAGAAVAAGRPASALNRSALDEALGGVGAAWVGARAPQSVFPAAPVGDPLALAQAMYDKYARGGARGSA